MVRLEDAAYLAHIERDSGLFRAALADCAPDARVPSCPEWAAADLLWHLAEVQHFWTTMVRQRPKGPDDYVEPDRPESYDALLELFDAGTPELLAALRATGPEEETWTWSEGHHTAGFIYRRQAHEALIHRLDAELAVGRAGGFTAIDPALAADGVHEALDVMFGGCPPWGTWTPTDTHLRVDCTDTGESVWVRLGHFSGTSPEGNSYDDDDLHVVDHPGSEPDAVVAGPAAALDAWLWRRGDDSEVTVAGDRSAYDAFRAAVDQPIN
jgi:uncharacterized protein (TIGR03083 family)